MASWRMNKAFAPLNRALRKRYPNIVIYGIGDPAHQATKSDHNPNKYGRVNAEDYMLRNGFDHADAVWLCAWLIQDKRTKYVIFNRRIWEWDTQEWRPYGGKNPHTDHVHHSVHDSADNNDGEWQLEKKAEVAEDMDAKDVWLYNTGTAEEPYQAVGRLRTIHTHSSALRTEVTQLGKEVAEIKGMLVDLTNIVNRLQ